MNRIQAFNATRSHSTLRFLLCSPHARTCAIVATLALVASRAEAQSVIKQPGHHPRYSVELEPHLVLQWGGRYGGADGFGGGVRANIPVVENGPIQSINNSMAIGLGLDATWGKNDCRWWSGRNEPTFLAPYRDCGNTEVWVPIVLQWNFFLTPVISVFGEPGIAIAYQHWDWRWWCNGAAGVGGPICDYEDSTTRIEPVFWAGGRFMFSDKMGATVRIGFPYVSAGVQFLL